MNKAFFIGNLTRDPELGETPNGVNVCHFCIAVNRSYTSSDGERQTDFFNVTCWRGLAESVARYCVKGSKVAVSGSVQLRVWEDNDGIKHQSVDVIAQDVEFLTSKKQSKDDEWEGYNEACRRREESGYKSPSPQTFDDDDLPF